jgi:beta-N-acetylhexosaminidase
VSSGVDRPSDLDRLADAVLLPGFLGTEPPDWVRAQVARGLAGVVLFARNVRSPEQVAALTAALRAERADVLVAVDEEGGDVTRLDAASGSPVPGPFALGVVDDEALTRSVSHALGRRLAAAGITVDLAPVADVNSNPDNPVIGVRSFGADAALVARHVRAAVGGLQAAGVAACAKHFPGHGDTAVDSHAGLPTVTGDLAEALLPFRAAVAAGVRAVMTGHLVVPGYGPAPATLNPALAGHLLRADLGYRGVVVSDGIDMGAAAGTFGLAESAVRALLAGVDAICVGGWLADEATVLLLHDAVVGAVRSGRLPEQRLAEAAGRVAELARWTSDDLGLLRPDGGRSPRSSGAEPVESPEEAVEGVGLAAARRAVRVWGAVRLPAGADPVLVELDPAPNLAAGRTAWGLSTVLPGRRPGTTVWRVGPAQAPPDPPAGRPLVVVTRDAARVPWQRPVLDRLLAGHPDAVVVEMGLPGAPAPARGYVATYGASRASAVAATEVLLGSGP